MDSNYRRVLWFSFHTTRFICYLPFICWILFKIYNCYALDSRMDLSLSWQSHHDGQVVWKAVIREGVHCSERHHWKYPKLKMMIITPKIMIIDTQILKNHHYFPHSVHYISFLHFHWYLELLSGHIALTPILPGSDYLITWKTLVSHHHSSGPPPLIFGSMVNILSRERRHPPCHQKCNFIISQIWFYPLQKK